MASTIITSSITTSTVATSTLSAFTTGISGSVEISGTNVAPRIWVVVGEAPGADILYSTDGLTWVPATYDSSVTGNISLNHVCWNGSNRWVAVGKGTHTILYSDDGILWKATSGLGFTGADGGSGISYNATTNRWVAVGKGTNTILYSDNGIVWNATSGSGFSNGGNGVANNGTVWMALGNGVKNILKSTDGISWMAFDNSTSPPSTTNPIPTATSYSDAVYCPETEKWVIVGTSANILNTIIFLDRQLNYAPITSGGFNGGGNSIAWNGCYLVAVGSDTNPAKTIQYSLDGTRWYPSFLGASTNEGPFNTVGYGVVWAENYFIAVGTDSTRTTRTIIYSADGKNWLSNDITGNENLVSAKGICYSRGSTGPLYALSIKGDTFIDGNLYITNGYPVSVNAITGSSSGGGGGGGGGGGSSVPVTFIRNLTDVSALAGNFSSIGVDVQNPSYHLDVNGYINSRSNIYINGVNVTTENSLASTIEGLGSFTYISSLSLQSTVQSFMTNCSSLQANFSSIGVNCNSPNYDIDVIGDINYTGTLYRNGLEFTGNASIPGINSIGGIGINKNYEGNAALDVSGQMVVSDYVTLNDGLDVSGNIMVNGRINASGDVSVSGTLTASSNVSVSGNLTAGSNVTVSGFLTVTNEYNAGNTIPILGTAVGQTITPGIKVGILNIGANNIDSSPVIWSQASLSIQASNGTVTMPRNNLSVGGNVEASGYVTAASVTATGAINCASLTVTGNITLDALTVNGVTQVANSIYKTASTAAAPPTTRGLSGSITYQVQVPSGNQKDIGLGPIINTAGGGGGGRMFMVSCAAPGTPFAWASMLIITSAGGSPPQQALKFAGSGLDWGSDAVGTPGNYNMLLNSGISGTVPINVTVTFLI